MIRLSAFAVLAICLSTVAAFAPQLHQQQQTSSRSNMALQGQAKNHMDVGKMIKGAAASAVFLGAFLASDPALALTPMDGMAADFGSTQVVAGRSGGRAGGRAGGGRRMVAPSRAGPSTSRSYSRTTVVRPMIAPSPIMVSPFGMGYGYNPMGGFGLGYGLGAMNDINREMRQEGQIRNTETELQAAQRKNMELEMRLKALEQNQQQQQLVQPQVQ
mmetsp:Transcript_14296/g.17237  ORF Transcript_14296/g.17237 Transcript_14296/m.17237 type:complete len:216 (+) Transcript_14296:54-701(+)|eukprot:CAMPEP_0195255550 /NCGR_PEP_ID=MMETSP0706-20130129/5715_1 /TAXON_ID=33640 /ORGANISM="Asterionellopsis glacialis, Strain CCMP134" /LENGTH=215 /DNA_ID=CAMNT_0040308439 /DNA_START=69 /DNA_END=716 /DNA_ORIENTATION=+